jgi:phosphoglycerate dehydrogenase-like enzyme
MEMNVGEAAKGHPSHGSNDRRARYPITLTADFYDDAGNVKFPDIGIDALASDPDVEVRRLDRHYAEVTPEQLADARAVLVLAPRVTARSLEQADDLLVLARFGVGYDGVDVGACTDRDVMLTIAKGAVDRPVAEATLAWMLALSYRMPIKDRLVRQARWDLRNQFMGQDLRDRTLGIIGFGGIGRELVRLLSAFGMRPPLVFDPHVPSAVVAEHGAASVSLEELLKQADFVSLHCPLTPGTRGLLGERELALMKPTAYLINTARGGIVDEAALDECLRSGRIAGAAIDCFVGEPLTAPPSFADLENVLLAPHAIAWTDGMFRDMGRTALRTILDLRQGRKPAGIVNPEVLERPRFQDKWRRFCVAHP